MEPEKVSSSKENPKEAANLKIIQWEDFEQELARLWSLSSALIKAKENKNSLQQKLESLIQVRSESLSRSNELEEMRQKLEAQKLVIGNMLMHSKVVAEGLRNQEEELTIEIRSLLVAAKVLSMASKQVQEANRLLAGERGYIHLENLLMMLKKRRQYMIAQVSTLYPVKPLTESTYVEKPNSSSNNSKSGLQLTSLPLKKMSLFNDKKELLKSAGALGHVAHAVSLIASYLDVPLRYSLRLGGSRSYIIDHAPSVEPMPSDSTSSLLPSTNPKPTEFPLFLEGQDTTRATYAIFLLNKDLEQLLNSIGLMSLGPRQVLANLNELLRTIQSQEI
ncbi:PREDICTED: UV radiation resistance-associated gene protein-like isoform X2 [Nelumbo nucifera]|uniref:UV radiation resistance-associated gene protein-like isoform X2 n=1 Tax=Nelumbo nucifera TaxID=4432 RepID=A0A1U7Z2F2_NELNU|nr:PREDICTED: UV radiation resistance-associated gene protein-like isoform X2 [Nelumbo nucifera]